MRAAAFHSGKHVTEADLQPASTHCAICGATVGQAVLRLQDEPTIDLLECPRCRGRSASRMPDDALLDAYYASYYDQHLDAEQMVTLDEPDVLVRRIVRHMKRTQRGVPTRVLDFGGGDGSVARGVARLTSGRETAHVTVVDYGPGVEGVVDGVPTRRCAELVDADGSYDVVIASAVLEHIPDVLPVLEQLIAKLSPGGLLYLRTPDMAGLIRIAGRVGIKIDFTYPGHLHDLGQPFWNELAEWWPPVRDGQVRLVASMPAPVETTFRKHPTRTAAAHVLKAPWWLLRSRYSLVGGWEAVLLRDESAGRG